MTPSTQHPPLVTLTTDFGHRDPYVAAMKGVLHQRCPAVHIEDLSHDLAPQDLIEAALFVEAAMPYYPPGTFHIVVVDPGVGTARRPLALKADGQYFICPDNGLMTLYLQQHPLETAHVITNPAWMLPEVSATFHGRDIFASAAAMLASGSSLEAVA